MPKVISVYKRKLCMTCKSPIDRARRRDRCAECEAKVSLAIEAIMFDASQRVAAKVAALRKKRKAHTLSIGESVT